jgi:hypothetical protein
MPVAAPVGFLPGHDHKVTEARRDLLLATRTTVGFPGLERMYQPDLDVSVRVRLAVTRKAGFARHGLNCCG